MDAFRDKGIISLRGLSNAVQAAKAELQTVSLESDTRILIGRESAIVVGKAGSTINRLTETHKVVIDVSETGDDVFACKVIGPALCVEACITEIDQVMEANKDIVETVIVDSIVRNTLLTDQGSPIKALQKKVNAGNGGGGGGIQLSFAKDGDNTHILQVKGRRAAVGPAKELVEATVQQIQSSLVTLQVDPFIVPKIIGKGGDTIKKLKGGDKTVNIEVDKTTGRVVIQSQDKAQVERVQDAIQVILDENQIERIALSPSTIKPLFRELIRSPQRNEINALVWMGMSEESSTIILRGTRENVSGTFVSFFGGGGDARRMIYTLVL